MLDQKLAIFAKGTFEEIDQNFMTEGAEALRALQQVQEKYQKNDTDTFVNELRDSIAGHLLGFDLVNTSKHGFDCKSTQTGKLLEVKSASFDASSWTATFNDTTPEKAEAFKDGKMYLALAVWKNASDLLFICYGQHEGIGEFLEEKVQWFRSGHTKRSTQSINLSVLVNTYNFKILAVNRSKTEVLEILKKKNQAFRTLAPSRVLDVSEFYGV